VRCVVSNAALILLVACDASQGALLSHVQQRDSGAGDGATSQPAARSAVRADMSVQYQLTDDVDTTVDAQLFVIDLFDATQQGIAALHAKNRVVIAYVSVGSLESWRQDAATFPRAAVGMPLADYPDERWLDIRSDDVRTAIAARLDHARDKGFDGVFFSTLGGYMQSTGFALTSADELDYASFLADAARTRGLSAGLSSDFELGDAIADGFDWALATGCIARGYCDELAAFIAQAKPVFDLETEGQRDAVCMQAAAAGIPTTLKHASYDAWRVPCP
jgi:hypothetical protein